MNRAKISISALPSGQFGIDPLNLPYIHNLICVQQTGEKIVVVFKLLR